MSDLPRRVIYSARLKEHIRILAERAKHQGIQEAFRHALRYLHEQLQARPLPPAELPSVFGEPCFTAPYLNLLVCQAALAPLGITFGVSLETQEINGEKFIGVYVQAIHLMEGA